MRFEMLDPRNDYVFKRLFADAPELLASLINAIRPHRPPVEVARVRNPLVLPSDLEASALALDMLATDARGRSFDVEVRMHRRREGLERSAPQLHKSQLVRMLSMQLAAAAEPSFFPSVVGIHLLDFDLFEDTDRANWCFELRDDRTNSVCLEDTLELDVLDLGKAASSGDAVGPLRDWATFFARWNEPSEIDRIRDPAVRGALHRLIELSADDHDVYRADLRARALRAADARREAAIDEGREEGRAAGRLEGAARLLKVWLTQRFGALPDDVVARLHAADWETLERWADRAVDGRSCDEVLA